MKNFSRLLIEWQKHHGRHDLPWQQTCDPYAVWLSEIMLQQTQVASVIPYYQRFIASFPNISTLAAASQDEVLAHWSGLGYYARGRNLHRAAQLVVAQHGGIFPSDPELVVALPGIGRSTAAAILAFSFGQRRAILDGNVKRVLARCFGIAGYPGTKAVESQLWQQAEALLPESDIETYTQALMDLGATVCTRKPSCAACPFVSGCVAYNEKRVAELPAPKPRKPLPQKETAMLVLLRQGEVYLEKRPPTGIWGGMWSLPEAPVLEKDLLDRLGMAGKEISPLLERQHTFTHFRLRIVPRVFEVTANQNKSPLPLPPLPQAGEGWGEGSQRLGARESSGRWLSLADAMGAALPKPVREILKGLK